MSAYLSLKYNSPRLRQRRKGASVEHAGVVVDFASPANLWRKISMDTLSQSERSIRMGLVKSTDTKPEWVVRCLVHRMGFRYRLHDAKLPGRPDLVFRSRKKVIFIHGCFWHCHSDCRLARLPKTRKDFWVPKLEANKTRDENKQQELRALGWSVLVIWECQLVDTNCLSVVIREFLEV